MENKTEQVFTYTYCAQEQAELKRFREKYAPRDPMENKMEQLRAMDAEQAAKNPETSAIWMREHRAALFSKEPVQFAVFRHSLRKSVCRSGWNVLKLPPAA